MRIILLKSAFLSFPKSVLGFVQNLFCTISGSRNTNQNVLEVRITKMARALNGQSLYNECNLIGVICEIVQFFFAYGNIINRIDPTLFFSE